MGKVPKTYLHKEGGSRKSERAGQGPGLERVTYRMLGKSPQVHATVIV